MAERAFLTFVEIAAATIAATGGAEAAHGLIAQAAALAPGDLEVLHLCGVLHRRHGDVARAFAQFARVLELSPGFAPTEFEIGHTCIVLRQTDTALGWYSRAIASAPGFTAAYLAAARTERVLGHPVAALDLLERALVLEPERVELLRERADTLAGQGEREGAITAYRRLAELGAASEQDEQALAGLLGGTAPALAPELAHDGEA